MKSYAFLFWAYNIVWLGIAGYLLFLFLRMQRVSRRLDAVERQVERSRSDAGQESSGS